MKRSEVLAIIKEEVEVVLTNNEMIEFFDIDPVKLLDEMMSEQEQEDIDVRALGKERETGSARKKRLRGSAAAGVKEITPQESGILKMVSQVLEQIAKEDNLAKYRPILIPLLKKLKQRSQQAGGAKPAEAPAETPAELEEGKKEDKWIQGADLKKGRCTPMGTPECPEGSPQYNLAKRFKGGDIHKANLKKGKNPHGPG